MRGFTQAESGGSSRSSVDTGIPAWRITPAQLLAIAAQLYAELLCGGYTQSCEFHYLQHAPDGTPYADPATLSWALADAAGSRPCGPDVAAQIAQLRAEGHVVIATLQYIEHYRYDPPADQIDPLGELAAPGAAAVPGSQGHHAQGFAFENGAFIHYGPGNLFFDQMDMMGTRQTFVDTYVVYDNRLIGVELWTGLIESWARPRLLTPEERADLLQTVFQASDW